MEWWLNHVGQMAQSVQDYSYDYTKVEIPDSYNIIMLLSYNDLLGNIFTQKLRFDVKHGLRRSMIAVEKMSVIFV